MERKAFANIVAAVVTAIISAVILYKTLVVGSLLREAGLFGMFLASMFSHLTVVGRDMFLPAFLPLTRLYHPLLLGVVAGSGEAIGEVTTYCWGLGIKEALEEDEKGNVLKKWIEKYGLIVILLVASSPLPDTPVILLAGSTRFPLRKFLIVEIVGKTILYSLGAAAGGFIFGHLSVFIEELILSAIVVTVSFAFCIIVSWSKTREKVLQLFRKILH